MLLNFNNRLSIGNNQNQIKLSLLIPQWIAYIYKKSPYNDLNINPTNH